jgi:hypothetical protein
MHREDCHDLARQCGSQSPKYQNLSRGTKTRPARLVPARPGSGTGPGPLGPAAAPGPRPRPGPGRRARPVRADGRAPAAAWAAASAGRPGPGFGTPGKILGTSARSSNTLLDKGAGGGAGSLGWDWAVLTGGAGSVGWD